jgi:hypothetical protein
MRQTETERDRQRQTETDRDRQRQTETDRDRQRQRSLKNFLRFIFLIFKFCYQTQIVKKINS